MKPLSHRLLNEQTPVVFVLKAISASPSKEFPLVTAEEQGFDGEYVGNVQLTEGGRTFEELEKQVKAYDKFQALSSEEKKKVKTPVLAPTVEIARVTHEDFPYLK